MTKTPIALTIAGSDSGGGAGIQADLKTFSALGVYGASAVTAATAQNTRGVRDVAPLPPESVAAQIDAVLEDLAVDAVKIGMLGGPELIDAVADRLGDSTPPFSIPPIILDPVMVAKSGDALLPESAVDRLRDRLMPRAALLTPNLPEAARLLDAAPAASVEEMAEQGAALRAHGPAAVLVKGGHGTDESCTDVLVTGDGATRLAAPRQATRNTHGTGCAYSSAIAAGLATGQGLETAVRTAHEWLQGAIHAADGLGVGGGRGPVHHFHAVWGR